MPFVERNRGGGLLGFRPLGYKDGGNANPSLWERYLAAQRGEDPPKKELKWKPKIPFEKGISKTVTYYKNKYDTEFKGL